MTHMRMTYYSCVAGIIDACQEIKGGTDLQNKGQIPAYVCYPAYNEVFGVKQQAGFCMIT